jgi:hypothetical protein
MDSVSYSSLYWDGRHGSRTQPLKAVVVFLWQTSFPSFSKNSLPRKQKQMARFIALGFVPAVRARTSPWWGRFSRQTPLTECGSTLVWSSDLTSATKMNTKAGFLDFLASAKKEEFRQSVLIYFRTKHFVRTYYPYLTLLKGRDPRI